MTTIAWDGETLAADRCSWSGCVRRKTRKVFKIKAKDGDVCLVAFCGSQAFCMAVMAWMVGKQDKPNCADFGLGLDDSCAVVIDSRYRVWSLGNRLQYCRMNERIFASGGGQEFAWGALEAGATAIRAVQIAIKRSDYAGFGVDSVRF